MNICFVCCEYPPGPHGGIGTFVQVLARALVEYGHEVRVIGCYEKSYPAADYEVDHGVRVWRQRIPNYRLSWIQARYRLFRTIWDWSHSGETDIVSVPDYQGWAAAWPELPVPVGVRLHGSSTYFALEMQQQPHGISRWLEHRSLHRADFWCSVSHYTAERTASIFHLTKPCSAVLYNPVEVPPETDVVPRAPHDVVFTGTLTQKKGIIPLIHAWPEVIREHAAARLHIYGKDGRRGAQGSGSMKEYLLSLLPPDIAATITFHGHQPREAIFKALAAARLAVFPSYAEAFAIAPLESMARGCPTIYSQRGSGPELIRHDNDGLLIDPDQPSQIAAAIRQLLADDALALRLGREGRKRVEDRFTIERIIPENEAFYRECIESFHTRRRLDGRTRAAASIGFPVL